MLAERPGKRLGQFKERANRAGGTDFVLPEHVEGTLVRGFEIYQSLPPGMQRALFMHFLVAECHPFDDGNGRTGWVLNILYLIEQELLSLPILYLSHFIVENKTDYYRLLNQVTSDHAWEPWILYLLLAVEQTTQFTTQKIAAVRGLIENTRVHVHQHLPKIYSYELLTVIFEQPYCRIKNLVDNQIAKRQTASEYLKQLCKIGVLKEVQVGKEKLFIHLKLVELMTQDSNEFETY